MATTTLTLLSGLYDNDVRTAAPRNGAWSVASEDLEVFMDATDSSTTLLSFASSLAADTQITSATLSLTPKSNSATTSWNITFSITTGPMTEGSEERIEVTSTFETVVDAWTAETPFELDVTTYVQAVLDHASYVENLAILLEIDASNNDEVSKLFYSYDGDTSKDAELIIVTPGDPDPEPAPEEDTSPVITSIVQTDRSTIVERVKQDYTTINVGGSPQATQYQIVESWQNFSNPLINVSSAKSPRTNGNVIAITARKLQIVLKHNTSYKIRIKTKTAGVWSDWSAATTFRTRDKDYKRL